jgi:subtilisin family serine protease
VLAPALARPDPPPRPWVEPRLARALEDPVAADAELRAQDVERRQGTRTGELRVMLEPPRGLGAEALPLAELEALGAHVQARSRSFVRISAPPAVLRRVAELGGIRALRFPFKPVPALGTGAILSEAVALTGAGALQTSGFTGAGVKVAVVDAGFLHLGDAETLGEIPASVIPVDFTGNGIDSGSAHGTSVTEEVADVAPGAQIYVIAFSDELELQNAADYLRDNGIRIANLSINFFGTSYYDDSGPINDIINHSHDVDGVFWAVAAGNWAFRHWRGPWVDANGNHLLEFTPGNERLNVVSELTDVCWTLNWNQYPDHYTGTPTDLDLFVYSKSGAVVASSQFRQTPGVLPVEQACYTRNTSQEPYQIAVRRFSGPTTGLDLTLVGSGAAVDASQGVAGSSILDPSDAHGAFTVAAINQANWTQPPPGPFLENFSSLGPTLDGRIKPDITAPDGTQTYYYGAALGTSFASPVVAGAAALLAQQAPGITANQLRAALVARTHDVGPPGLDTGFGWGELALSPLVLPLDSDGDLLPDASDPCPFAANNVCNCGDVDGSGTVAALDETALRIHLTDPQNPSTPGMVHPELCNVRGAAAPFPLDCLIDDWVVLRRARAGLGPGIQPVCAPALPR